MAAVVLVVAPYATKTGRIRALPPFLRSSRRVPVASPFLRQVPRQPELAFAASSSSSNSTAPSAWGFSCPPAVGPAHFWRISGQPSCAHSSLRSSPCLASLNSLALCNSSQEPSRRRPIRLPPSGTSSPRQIRWILAAVRCLKSPSRRTSLRSVCPLQRHRSLTPLQAPCRASASAVEQEGDAPASSLH